MIRYVLVLLILILLNGCCSLFCVSEDQEVSKKCTPVRSLLSKNYDLGFKLNVGGFGGGGDFRRTGSSVAGNDAIRVVEVDAVCRAYVAGTVNAKDYSEYLLKSSAASLIDVVSAGDPESINKSLNELTNVIANLKLPVLYSDLFVNNVAKLAINYSKMDPASVSKELENAYKSFSGMTDKYSGVNEGYYVLIASKIDGVQAQVKDTAVDIVSMQANQDFISKRLELLEGNISEIKAIARTNSEVLCNIDNSTRKVEGGVTSIGSKVDNVKEGLIKINDAVTDVPDAVSKTTTASQAKARERWVKHSTFNEVLRLYFNTNSFALDAPSIKILQENLQKYRNLMVRFEIVGYADKTGSRRGNERLSQMRAKAVKEWIIDNLNIPESNVTFSGRIDGTAIFSPTSHNRVVVIKVTEAWQ